MRFYTFLLAILLLLSNCNQPPKNRFIIKGEIKGLTKGTLHLEKVIDTTIVLIDSFVVRKDGLFEMSDSIKSPEIYYVRLKEYPHEYILVFAEEGIITVNSKIEKFATAAKITGSKNHLLWQEYQTMIRKFNDEKLVLFKDNLMAEKEKNQSKLDSLEQKFRNHLKRRYLYTTNFAVRHADMEVSPYLALTELYDANTYLLDTIAHSMKEKINHSMYGIKFKQFLANRKTQKTDSLNN